jgi:hypothetical protein
VSTKTSTAAQIEEKRALLAELLREKGRRMQSFPLSFAQERLWFLDQLVPGSHLYNLPKAVQLTGPLNIGALEQAISEISRRHEILRTTYSLAGGRTIQVIGPQAPVCLPVAGLEDLPEASRAPVAGRLGKQESQRPFDLGKGPVLRGTLLRVGMDNHILLVTLHHIAGDGLSLSILVLELALLYQSYSRGEPSSLEELAIQYADFAVWQRERMKGDILETHMAYWKRQFARPVPRLLLPTDHPRLPVQTHRGDTKFFHIPATIARSLSAVGRQKGATLFMTLLAAFKTLLYRYSGQDDIIVGSPISNRHRVETERLIGCLINTLALRTDMSGHPTFNELLGRVRETTRGAYAHQDLPFDKLVQELQPERRLSPTPLFQVWFVLDHVPTYTQESMAFAGLNFNEVYSAAPAAQFDLTLSMCELGQELIGFWNFKTDLFGVESIERMIEHFKRLIEEITINPNRSIIDLPLTSESTDAEKAPLSSVEDAQAEFSF